MAIFVSEPARPGPERLPEALRKRQVSRTDGNSPYQAFNSREQSSPQPEPVRDGEQELAKRAAAGYRREAGEARTPEQRYLPVSHLIREGVIALPSSATLAQARALMVEKGIHHLVILSGEQVAGLVDWNWLLERQFEHARAEAGGTGSEGAPTLDREILPSFITVTPETDAHDLAHRMLGYQIGSAIVIDGDNRAIALVTATDYLRLYAQQMPVHESI